MSINNLRERELGITGLAILRNHLTENTGFTKKAVKTIRKIITSYDDKYSKKKIYKHNTHSGYTAWSQTYDEYPNLLLDIEEPIVKKMIPKDIQGKAIDIACGTGRYSKILKELGVHVTGVDQSSAMLSQARKKISGVNFVKGEITNLPFDQDHFDFAICALALTHMKSLKKAISEISRVVKIGGKIIISDLHPWFVTLGGPAKFYNKKGDEGYIREHVHWHSEYLNLFNELKLKLIKIKEPQLKDKHLISVGKGSIINSEINQTALANLPLALIWVLEKR